VSARFSIADAAREFEAQGIYLNTATMGLPPRRAVDAGIAVLREWQSGTSVAADFDVAVERSRSAFARLVGVHPDEVAIGPQVSVFTGLVAAALPPGAEVLVPTGEFTSVTFPFWAAGHDVREVPLAKLADHVTPRTALVATSLVQSADGRLLDLDRLLEATAAAGARVLLDITQAAGWLPVAASRADYTVCGGYKFLLAPRGTAFFIVHPDRLDTLTPYPAGWYAGLEPWSSIYGGPLRLARTARRFDISPAWHAWVGQAESLELLNAVGTDAIWEHATGLAADLALRLGQPDPHSAILSLPVAADAAEALARAGITAAVRAGRLRVSFHLYNTADEVVRAAEVLNAGSRTGSATSAEADG
jgi:selenocysteine lyase/cysteine desulfurase